MELRDGGGREEEECALRGKAGEEEDSRNDEHTEKE